MVESSVTSQVVVITGASAGVGRATALAFARQGASVALIARGLDGLAGAKRDVEAAGGRALVFSIDVADAAAVERAAEETERAFGAIDVWVNNAMTSVFSPFVDMTIEEFVRVTAVTYLGVVNGTMAALKRMSKRNRGTIVQVGSALAYRSIPLQSAYCGAKAGVRGFTDSLRCELHHDKSRVTLTMVHLPALNTPQFGWVKSRLPRKAQPVPPIFQPEVAARAILYAARSTRRELYVGFPAWLAIVAGAKLAPGLADRYLGRTGYDAQQTDEPVTEGATNNLFTPVSGDHGSHGTFDTRSRSTSLVAEAATHRGLLAAAVVGSVAAALFLLRAKRSR